MSHFGPSSVTRILGEVPLPYENSGTTKGKGSAQHAARDPNTPPGVTARLNFAWRLVGTGLGFALFGLGGLVLSTLVFPLSIVLVRDPEKRQEFARSLIGGAFRAFIRMMKSLGVMSYEIHGTEHMSDTRRTVIIANHPSLIDVVFLVSFFPRSECVIKRAVTRNPFMRGTVSAANYISNENPEQLLATCSERVMAGFSLILFPEGTRSTPGERLRFKPGATAIAVRASARVLPILIECRPPTLRKNEPWYHIPTVRPHWIFRIHPPLEAEKFACPGDNQRQATRKLQSGLLDYYESHLYMEPDRNQDRDSAVK